MDMAKLNHAFIRNSALSNGRHPVAARTLQLSFGFDRSIDVGAQLPTTIRSNGAVPYTYARLYEPIT
jgi:hypothetical protein